MVDLSRQPGATTLSMLGGGYCLESTVRPISSHIEEVAALHLIFHYFTHIHGLNLMMKKKRRGLTWYNDIMLNRALTRPPLPQQTPPPPPEALVLIK